MEIFAYSSLAVLALTAVSCTDKAKETTADHVVIALANAPASRIVSSTEGIEANDKWCLLTRGNPCGI